MNNTHNLTRKQVVSQMRSLLASIDSAIAEWKAPGVIHGSNFVIRTSPGLFLKAQDDGKFLPRSILQASKYSQGIANVLASQVRDGAGNRGTPVYYIDALNQERTALACLIADIEITAEGA